MNDRCEHIRERIEDSIGRALGADEQAALDLHCAECESCREYRKGLIADHSRLDAFAALHSTSEARFEERLIEMLPAETPARAQRSGFCGAFARVPRAVRIAAAVTAAIVVILGIDLLRGIHYGPVPAFASVMERMEKAETVTFRDREWYLGEWHTIKWGFSRSCSRVERAYMITISHDQVQDTTMEVAYDTTLVLYPALKRGAINRIAVVPLRKSQLWKGLSQPRSTGEKALSQRYKARMDSLMRRSNVEGFASWYKRDGFSFVRRERREGRNAAVYQSIGRNHTSWTWWVDEETLLPFRFEIVRPRKDLHGLQLSDFLPPGSSPSAAAGWTALGPGEPSAIYDEFQWNTKLDTSYFSLTPPSGYTIVQVVDSATREESRKLAMLNGHGVYWGGAVGSCVPYGASALAKGLSMWASLSGGALPDELRYLGDSTRVKPLLVAKHNKGGVPGDELRAAISDASELEQAFEQAQYGQKEGNLHYVGRGIASGDSTRVVCWGKLRDIDRESCSYAYWIMYADFHCVPSMTRPKIREK
jgi:hypothetical protein